MQRFPIAYVEWVDAHGGSGQYNLQEVQESHTDFMYSCGLLVKETDDEVVIVQDVFQYNGQKPQARQYEVIPKINIRDIRKFDTLG